MANTANPAGSPAITDLHITPSPPAKRPPDPLAEGQSEFRRFEDLTRKVAQVPKAELDEKRKKT
jgi:hypothetical protein